MSEHNSRTSRASLFDIRNVIAALLGIYGVVLVIMSFTTSDSDLAKASSINANLWVGIGQLLFALFFMVWAYLRPIVVDEEQLEKDKREDDEEANRRREGGPTT